MNSSSTPQAADILALADKIRVETDPNLFVQLLAEYVLAFDAWSENLQANAAQVGAGEKGAGTAQLSAAEVAEARQLLQVHEDLVRQATAHKSKTEHDLSSLRQRGKRILAYVDQLPKSISLTGVRKG